MAVFQNPFSRTDAPDTMTLERRLRGRHTAQTVALAVTMTSLALYGTPLIVYLWAHGLPFSAKTLHMAIKYYELLGSSDPFAAHRLMASRPDFVPGSLHLIPGANDYQFRQILAYVVVGVCTIFACGSRQLFNTHKRMVMKQNAQWMKSEHLRDMELRKQVGIRGGQYMALGRWIGGLRHDQPVRMIETLSALCLAPPGTGKTAAIAIPTLVNDDNVSIIAFDAKPELHKMAGHHRAKVSNTHVMDWSKTDEHEAICDDQGIPIVKDGAFVYRHTVYSRFNPLCKAMVPPSGSPQRDTYFEAISNVLIPRESKKADYFPDQGRDALIGFIHAIVAKINDSDDENRWSDMPRRWHGKEASLPMLIDWYSTSQFGATSKQADQGEQKQEADPLGDWIRQICEQINPDAPENSSSKAVTARGFSSLSTLVNMADRQRSGVLGTMVNGLNSFRNAAVQQRMESSDFSPDDVRGVRQPDGTWRPFTLFICVNAAEADAFAVITTMLFETLSQFLLSYGPGEINPNTGQTLGPFPVTFLLDEFARLKQIPAVLSGPDIGRSKKVSYLIIAQATPQIRTVYSADHEKQLKTTTAVKIIFPQNEQETIKDAIATVGRTTIRRPSYSTQEGLHADVKQFSWNRSDTIEETDLLRQEDLTSMPKGTHILLVQGEQTRPMRVKSMLYFEDPIMRTKVWARGCSGTMGTEFVPPDTFDMHVNNWMRSERLDYERKQARYQYATEQTDLAMKEHDEAAPPF